MDIRAFYARIDDLGSLLRAEGMAHGVDVWLSAARLLDRLEQQNKLPKDASELAPLLGPLFCKSPEEQARFPILYAQWLNGESSSMLAAQNCISGPGHDAFLTARTIAQQKQRIWIVSSIVLIICLIALLIVKAPDWFLPKPAPVPAQQIDEKIEKPAEPVINSEQQPATKSVAIVDRVNPRPQPEPDYVRQDWENAMRHIGWVLFAFPWLLGMGYIAWRYQRNTILRRNSASADDLLHQFHFDQMLQPFFGGARAEQALRELNAAKLEPTRQLHISATVEATARSGGYFQPVCRNRRVAPEHVLLVRSQHRNDQQAALAEELEQRFKMLGLSINTYHFRDDPRWLVRWGDDHNSAKYYQLHQLLARHETARLMIISETAIVFHPYSGEIRTWLDDFAHWQDKVWLHPRDAGAKHAALLAQKHFLMLPLAQDNLPQLVKHLTKPQSKKLLPRQPHTWPLPGLIAAEPDAWLGEQPPYGADLPLLLRQLDQFLGTNGLRLLRAVAVYPKPHWSLTRALDYLLFGHLNTAIQSADPPQRREQRLARLSRLPWLTHAHLPDWLREVLLLGMGSHERKQITAAWQRLIDQLTGQERSHSLSLEIRVPSKHQLRVKLDDLRAAFGNDAINDPVFANIVLGGKLGLLDFHIPRAMARLLPGSWQSIILRPALVTLFWTLFSTGMLYAAWHTYGQDAFIDFQRNRVIQENMRWPVAIRYHENTSALMTALQSSLKSMQFDVSAPSQSDAAKPVGQNIIRYAVGGRAVAERIERSLMWFTYGAKIALQKTDNLNGKLIQVELNQTYQHGAAFNDVIGSFIEPEMVRIPPGKFLMGSPDNEEGRWNAEGPQRDVTIAYAFEMSKYEVTFDEYDAFVKATNRKLPNDRGWGRGTQPVINVSWDDAQAYVKWLSDKTGKKYRLPTEAEWEYAA
ncbi:MAG: formylglycine-generating enzyme family protein, partial [Nitrosomonas sp.]|nr:formylglycine-generating enzyme family protein [Nitrosomonas sp.]